jgi:hypothetical protein
MTAPPRSVAGELASTGYAHGSIAAELGINAAERSAWDSFAQSWDDLPMDQYMADHGRYRLRRYGEFRCSPAAGTAELLPHRAYTQTKATNYLNGGVERLFAPIHATTARSDVLHTLLCWACGQFQPPTGHSTWFAQVFQNRIVCSPGVVGKPTPEGPHHDGVDYVLTVMVKRHQVTGGVSVLYHDGDRRKLLELELDEPGAFLLNDDATILHAVTPIGAASPGGEGHRDVLVAIFTHMEDGKIPTTG